MKRRYYLHEVSSKWNKEKKRAQKITGMILGRITEDNGFTPSKEKIYQTLQTKELSVKSSEMGPFCRIRGQGCSPSTYKKLPPNHQIAEFRVCITAISQDIDTKHSEIPEFRRIAVAKGIQKTN